MPPTSQRKKRKADDGSASGSAKSKKMTKAEKAAEKARVHKRAGWTMNNPGREREFDAAWDSWMENGGDPSKFPGVPVNSDTPMQPTKRRKTNNASASTASNRSAKKPSFVNNESPTAAAAAPRGQTTTPTSAKKQSKKEALQEARARSQQWAAEERAKSAKKAASKSPSTATATTSAPSSAKKPAATSTTTSSFRRSTGSATDSTKTGSPRRNTGTTNLYRNRRTAPTPLNDNANTIPKPPTQFPTMATTPQTQAAKGPTDSGSSPLVTTVFEQPPAVRTKPTPAFATGTVRTPEPIVVHAAPRIDVGVIAPQQQLVQPAEDESKLQPLFRKLFLLVFIPLLAMSAALLVVGKYNPKTGIWMISGTTRRHCSTNLVLLGSSCKPDKSEAYVTEEEPIDVTTLEHQRCYADSPGHILDLLDASVKDSVVELTNCPNGIQQCPFNAICYKGNFLDCQAPVWVLYEGDESREPAPMCVLSQAVNDTYAQLVGLIESWSIQQLCLNHTGVPSPVSFYTQDDTDPFAALNVVEATDAGGLTTISAQDIPLFPWGAVYRTIDGPEEVEEYLGDLSLWQIANDANKKKLVFDDVYSKVVSVGLTPHQYDLVERNKLPGSCKLWRGAMSVFSWSGNLCWSILTSIFAFFWYCLTVHPYITVPATLIIALLQAYRRRKARLQRQRKRVNEIRQIATNRLKAALNQTPGTGMRQGEIAVLHLRDSLAFELHGYDDEKKREEFMYTLWPLVCQQIKCDNRISKSHRVVNGAKRDLWMWAAGEDTSQS